MLINHSNLVPHASLCVKDNTGELCCDCTAGQKAERTHAFTMGLNTTDQDHTNDSSACFSAKTQIVSLFIPPLRRFMRLDLASE